MINPLFAAACTYFGFLPPERCRALSFDEKIASWARTIGYALDVALILTLLGLVTATPDDTGLILSQGQFMASPVLFVAASHLSAVCMHSLVRAGQPSLLAPRHLIGLLCALPISQIGIDQIATLTALLHPWGPTSRLWVLLATVQAMLTSFHLARAFLDDRARIVREHELVRPHSPLYPLPESLAVLAPHPGRRALTAARAVASRVAVPFTTLLACAMAGALLAYALGR